MPTDTSIEASGLVVSMPSATRNTIFSGMWGDGADHTGGDQD